jgi:hypothetical protein
MDTDEIISIMRWKTFLLKQEHKQKTIKIFFFAKRDKEFIIYSNNNGNK